MPTSSTLTIPNEFDPRTTAVSADVNENFNAVATLINTTGLGTNNVKDGTVTSDLLDTSSVTTDKIPDENVTRAKLAALGQQESLSSGSFSTTSASVVDVTNLSISITTTGRPVMVSLIAKSTISEITGTANTTLTFVRGSTTIASFKTTGTSPASSFLTIDNPAADTYTYKVQADSDGADTLTISNCYLLVWEL